MKKVINYLLLFVLFIFPINIFAKENDTITLYLFHGDGCPHCEEEMKFLDSFVEKGLIDKLTKLVNSKFTRIDHEEVITILKNAKVKWEFEPKYGEDIANQNADYAGTYDVEDDTLVCSNDYFVITQESGYCVNDPDTEVNPLDIGNG